ncbi:PEP-CTERM sorting domain-containing protein [Xylophilus rhododendri]|uniref:PEP-CTERM sorting domain-containing protein n=1 Tax=Xylophilus rhododendri TaxID=2697032 RepID=A0A857J187_9BURK|nr:PEP-CTERM sorting domain-containing protein [Xylophilus rhododendri]QHI96851.1 PEP-CTERM sorting domain-containing protein [Xylophilus rhododendri]
MKLSVKSALPKIAAAALMFAGHGAFCAANLVANGDFATGDFSGWTQFGNTDSTFVSGLLSQAWFGPANTAGGIHQTLATTPGLTYHVEFLLENSQNTPASNSYEVGWNGATIFSAIDAAVFSQTPFSTDIVASSTSTDLRFGFVNDGGYYRLSGISVAAVPAVPEPRHLVMLLAGLGLMATVGLNRPRRHA